MPKLWVKKSSSVYSWKILIQPDMMTELVPRNVLSVIGQLVSCHLCCVKQKSTHPSSQTCLNSLRTLIDSQICLFSHGKSLIQLMYCICTFFNTPNSSSFDYFPTSSKRALLTKSWYNRYLLWVFVRMRQSMTWCFPSFPQWVAAGVCLHVEYTSASRVKSHKVPVYFL